MGIDDLFNQKLISEVELSGRTKQEVIDDIVYDLSKKGLIYLTELPGQIKDDYDNIRKKRLVVRNINKYWDQLSDDDVIEFLRSYGYSGTLNKVITKTIELII